MIFFIIPFVIFFIIPCIKIDEFLLHRIYVKNVKNMWKIWKKRKICEKCEKINIYNLINFHTVNIEKCQICEKNVIISFGIKI